MAQCENAGVISPQKKRESWRKKRKQLLSKLLNSLGNGFTLQLPLYEKDILVAECCMMDDKDVERDL